MANTVIEYKEIRFVLEEELTQAYVFINNLSQDGLLGVHGWHHKTFSASKKVVDILNGFGTKEGDPLFWPQKAPKE